MKKLTPYILILTLILTACQPKPSPDEQNKTQSIAVQANHKELSMAMLTPDTFCPVMTKVQPNAEMLNTVFEGLFAYTAQYEQMGVLADRYVISPDGLTWTITLRDNVKWQDGEPFSAEDVNFTFRTIMATPDSYYRYALVDVEQYSVVNGSTFKIRLKQPNAMLWGLLTFPIIAKHQYQKLDLTKPLINEKPIGTGAWMISNFNPYQRITLKPYDGWWGKQKPLLETIYFRIFPDAQTMLQSLNIRETDVLATRISDFEKYLGTGYYKAVAMPSDQFEFLAFNQRSESLKDVAVRQALAASIDRHKIVSDFMMGHAEVSDLPMPKEWVLQDSITEHFQFDASKAKTLFMNAGWQDANQDGLLERTDAGINASLTIKLLTNADNALRGKILEEIAAELKAQGVKATVVKLPWDQYQAALKSGNYDLALSGLHVIPNGDFRTLFHSKAIATGMNIMGFEDAVSDHLMDQVASSVTNTALLTTERELYTQLIRQVPILGLYFTKSHVIVRQAIQGNFVPTTINPYGGILTWHFE